MLRGLVLAASLALAGCAPEVVPPLGPPRTAPAGPVFVVHGIWPDAYDLWVDDVVAALHAAGIEAIPIPYQTFVLGYLDDTGTDPSARELALFESDLTLRHGHTACAAPLQLYGVGFSAGTAVLQKAAARGARFRTLYFGGSPLPAWSDALEAVLAAGRVRRVVNYFSPVDPIAFFTCGSGVYGFHGGDDALEARVDNRLSWNLHWPAFWLDDVAAQVAAEIAEDAGAGPGHTCLAEDGFREWYLRARDALTGGASEEGVER